MRRFPLRLVAAGDAAIVAELDERIDPLVNARAVALADSVRAASLPGVRDVVPSFRSVTVYFDPVATDRTRIEAATQEAAATLQDGERPDGKTVALPVCYDAEFAADLDEVAGRTGLDRDAVVQLHTGRTYRVFMLGFVPGFAYLGTLDPRIALPRRSTPRPEVPAGSVAIAGELTAVYPSPTPGGWHIIGRTPVRMFAPDRAGSSLLNAGDSVRFVAIDRGEFARLDAAEGAAA